MKQDFLLTLDQASNLINQQLNESVYTPSDLINYIAQVRGRLLICRPFADMVIGQLSERSFFVFEGCFRLVDSSVSNVVMAAVGSIVSGSNEFSGIESFKLEGLLSNNITDGFYVIVDYDGFADSALEALAVLEDAKAEKSRLLSTLRVQQFYPRMNEIYVFNSEFRAFVDFALSARKEQKIPETMEVQVANEPIASQELKPIKGDTKSMDDWVLWRLEQEGGLVEGFPPYGFQVKLIEESSEYGYKDDSVVKRSFKRLGLKRTKS